MFEECTSLAELNAARIQATTGDCDLVSINNAYNKRRQEILTAKKPFMELSPIIVQPREVIKYCGVPVIGRSEQFGVIQLTESGFLY